MDWRVKLNWKATACSGTGFKAVLPHTFGQVLVGTGVLHEE